LLVGECLLEDTILLLAPLSRDPCLSEEKTKRPGSERMSQLGTLLPFHSSRLQGSHTNVTAPSHCEEDENSEEALRESSVMSDEKGFDKTCKTVMKSRLHPSTAQEKYHYQTGRLQITNRETPGY